MATTRNENDKAKAPPPARPQWLEMAIEYGVPDDDLDRVYDDILAVQDMKCSVKLKRQAFHAILKVSRMGYGEHDERRLCDRALSLLKEKMSGDVNSSSSAPTPKAAQTLSHLRVKHE